MKLDFLTILFTLFVPVLYMYLLLVRKGIIIKAVRQKSSYLSVIAAGFFFLLAFTVQEFNLSIRLILSGFILLSFLLDQRGFSEEALVVNVFSQRGISYSSIEKIVLLKKKDEIKLNYFINERRGPLLTFKVPIEELLTFLEAHLKEKAKVEILIEEE